VVVAGRFAGKVALVTGAASGIGRAVSERLAAEGAQVFGTDIVEAGLAATAELVAAAGGAMTTRRSDVSDPVECAAAVAAAVATYGKLDVLGNIAGIARAEHVADATPEGWRKIFGVNVDGVFFMAQAAIPHLLETHGNIVNIASNAGIMGQAYTVAYCATKGAVVNMTRALAMEFVKQPIRINAIAPGGVDTALSHNFQAPENLEYDLMAPYVGFRGMTTAEHIAGLFAYVASEEAAPIHGAILSADNGVTAG